MGIELGNSVIFTSVTSRISHPQSMQGVVVDKKRNMLWGFNLKVQVVLPSPLYARGEIFEAKEEQLTVIDKIKPR